MEHLENINYSDHTTWQNGGRESFEDFDYCEVDRRLLGEIKSTPADVRAEAAAVFAKIMAWVFTGSNRSKVHSAFVKFAAFTSGLRPDLVDDMTGEEIGKLIGVTKQSISKTALLVSPTWAEIEAVTDKVRDTLKAQGVLGQQEEAVTVFDSLSWTEAQKKNASQFVPGQRLRFVRQTKHFDRGDTVEVVATVENGLRVRRLDGTEVNFIPANVAASFDVGEARELKVAAGDWLLLQANHGKEFINGERVQIREIQNGRIALADGRSLPSGFNAFTHGYAVTSHSSQSKTVDEVLLVASSRSFGAVNREQFYVSISRGRERVHVFTDDADLLARRVTDSHTRKAAVELQGLRDGLAKLGFIGKERLEEKTAAPVAEDSCAIRPRRPMRQTRLSTIQRLATAVEDVRRWLGLDQTEAVKETVAEKVGPAESVKQAEKIAPAVKETPGQKLRREMAQRRQQQHSQRRSSGIHI